MEGCVAPAAGEPDDVVLPVVDKLGALLDVDVIGADVEDHPNVAFVLGEEHINRSHLTAGLCWSPLLLRLQVSAHATGVSAGSSRPLKDQGVKFGST